MSFSLFLLGTNFFCNIKEIVLSYSLHRPHKSTTAERESPISFTNQELDSNFNLQSSRSTKQGYPSDAKNGSVLLRLAANGLKIEAHPMRTDRLAKAAGSFFNTHCFSCCHNYMRLTQVIFRPVL